MKKCILLPLIASAVCAFLVWLSGCELKRGADAVFTAITIIIVLVGAAGIGDVMDDFDEIRKRSNKK